MLYVGIDWAEKAHRVCIRDDERIHAELEVPNSAVGAADLLAKIAAIEPDKRSVLFAIEANHGPFIDAILDAGYTIYPLNPKAVERYRDRFRLARTKTDWIDARVLADILRTDRQAHQPLKPDSEETTMLRLLTRDCAELEKTQTMLRNQLRSALLCYFPLATELFSDLASPTALAFLKAYPTHQDARRATPEALEALLRAQRYPRAAKRARELYQALQQAPRLEHWRTLLRARAIENQVFVVGVNRCGRHEDFEYFGHSLVVSPSGAVLVEAGEGEEIVRAELDMEELSRVRSAVPIFADRRPEVYAAGMAPERVRVAPQGLS